MDQLSRMKRYIAARWIETGLALHTRDGDPFAVHCLAAGGAQLARDLIEYLLLPRPAVELDTMKHPRRFNNSMKHHDKKKEYFADDILNFADFDEELNDFYIQSGLLYLEALGHQLSKEAGLFLVWFDSIHLPASFESKYGMPIPLLGGEKIHSAPRDQQKLWLRGQMGIKSIEELGVGIPQLDKGCPRFVFSVQTE